MEYHISKYTHLIDIEEGGTFALFNSLILRPVFLGIDDWNRIVDRKISATEKKRYKELGIVVNNHQTDINAISELRKQNTENGAGVHLMYLVLTNKCNLGCKYCFVENGISVKDMTLITAFAAIDKFVDHNTDYSGELEIVMYGGEPLINWETIEGVLQYIDKLSRNINISLVSNGTLLDIGKIDILKLHNVSVGISIDGPKHINDKNRVFKNSEKSVYDTIIGSINLAKKRGLNIGLSMTVSEDLLSKQDIVIEWLMTQDSIEFGFNLMHFTDFVEENLWRDYYTRANTFLIKAFNKLHRCGINDDRLMRKISSFVNHDFKFSDCAAVGGNQLVVQPDGSILVCQGYMGEGNHIVGNIEKDTFEDIVNRNEFKRWKNKITLENQTCLACESIFICGGGCPCQAEKLFGSFEEIDKCFCIHTKDTMKWLLKELYIRS